MEGWPTRIAESSKTGVTWRYPPKSIVLAPLYSQDKPIYNLAQVADANDGDFPCALGEEWPTKVFRFLFANDYNAMGSPPGPYAEGAFCQR